MRLEKGVKFLQCREFLINLSCLWPFSSGFALIEAMEISKSANYKLRLCGLKKFFFWYERNEAHWEKVHGKR